MECYPPPPTVWDRFLLFFLGFICFGSIILVPLIVFADLITAYKTPTYLKICLAIPSGALGIYGLMIFSKWHQNAYHWTLTDQKLIRGKKKTTIIPFSSIQKIIPGLPDKMGTLLSANKFVRPDLHQIHEIQRGQTLCIKLLDGSILPFNVHSCINGTQLMQQLIDNLEEIVDLEYKFSSNEISILKYPKWKQNKVFKVTYKMEESITTESTRTENSSANTRILRWFTQARVAAGYQDR